MNCMRVPALQTLLLYSKSLDTNEDCTRILCDNWLEIRFLDAEISQKLLSNILYLRSSLEKLFQTRLEDRQFNVDSDESNEPKESSTKMRERARCLEKVLKRKLSEFLDSSVLYSLRRILPAELSKMFVKQYEKEQISNNQVDVNLLKEELRQHLVEKDTNLEKINETKGGFRINEYLTYNW
jgi:hypothetical protein